MNNAFRLNRVMATLNIRVFRSAKSPGIHNQTKKRTSDLEFAANFTIPCCIYRTFSDPRPEMSLSAAINRRSMISASSSRLARSLMAASYLSPRFLSSSSKAFTSFSIFSSSRLLRRKFLSNLATFGENEQQKIRRWQRFESYSSKPLPSSIVLLCKTSYVQNLSYQIENDLHENELEGRTHFHMNCFRRRFRLDTDKRQLGNAYLTSLTQTKLRRCYNR